MKALQSNKGITSLQVGVAIVTAFLIFFCAVFFLNRESSNRLRTALEESGMRTRLVQTMRTELLSSAEAEKSSVMADTDEASRAFADQSVQASQHVEKARVALQALVKKGSDEARLLDDFSSYWERLEAIDKEILSLSVQNTNLKAMRLSFGPAASAIGDMEKALDQWMDSAVLYPDAAGMVRLASRALTGALNILSLEAPHIAESTDKGMDRIEADMDRFDRQVNDALAGLDGKSADAGRPLLREAGGAYKAFRSLNAEIIGLSRRNSNVRSFEASLGQKRNVMAKCLESLDALQKAVQEGASYKATR